MEEQGTASKIQESEIENETGIIRAPPDNFSCLFQFDLENHEQAIRGTGPKEKVEVEEWGLQR